jgi:hypothetical protein
VNHPELLRHHSEIDTLISIHDRLERLLDLLQTGSIGEFLSEADPGFLATHAHAFSPHRMKIESWVDLRLKQSDVLRSAEPSFLKSDSTATLVARWFWGQQRLVRTCLVAADQDRFFDQPRDAIGNVQELDPDSHRRLMGGAAVLLPLGCPRLHVTVWPVVDLGWSHRVGPALRIGPYLEEVSRAADTSRLSPAAGSLLQRMDDWLVRKLNDV